MDQVCVNAISAADWHKAAVPLLQADHPNSVGAPARGRTRAAASGKLFHMIRSQRQGLRPSELCQLPSLDSSPECLFVPVLRTEWPINSCDVVAY